MRQPACVCTHKQRQQHRHELIAGHCQQHREVQIWAIHTHKQTQLETESHLQDRHRRIIAAGDDTQLAVAAADTADTAAATTGGGWCSQAAAAAPAAAADIALMDLCCSQQAALCNIPGADDAVCVATSQQCGICLIRSSRHTIHICQAVRVQ